MEGISGEMSDVSGPEPQFFFAPTQIQKRRQEWGGEEIAKRHARAWDQFAPRAKTWIEIDERTGRQGLKDAWLEVLSGGADPRKGLVVQL